MIFIFKSKVRKIWDLLIVTMVIGVLLFVYIRATRELPFSHWDEMLWVGRSYFVELFIKGDFENRVWKSPESYDQPKLGEYMYGLWIYPRYVFEVKSGKFSGDYVEYLISNGFYMIDESFWDKYKMYNKNHQLVLNSPYDSSENRSRSNLVKKYGKQFEPTIDLLEYARRINIFWLLGAVVIGYFVVKRHLGRWSWLFFLIYGTNGLMVSSSLKAHSEALFIFLFNSSLWLIYLYIKQKRDWQIVLLSIVIGLCVSTKLNGMMLLLIFSVAYVKLEGKIGLYRKIVEIGLVALVSLSILFLLNPYMHSDPLGRLFSLFEKREIASSIQMGLFPDRAMTSVWVRGGSIINNFFGNDNVKLFNGVYGQSQSWFGVGLGFGLLFVAGLVGAIRRSLKGSFFWRFVLLILAMVWLSMMWYLVLDWGRYYIQLVWPILLIEILGAKLIVERLVKVRLVKYWRQLLLLAGGSIVGLIMVEMGLKATNYPWWGCKEVFDSSEYHLGIFEPVRGWGYAKNTKSIQNGVVYRFGADGQRIGNNENGIINSEKKKVLVVGDSILFGHRINYEDTFGAKLQQKLGDGYEVLNFSVQGYGTDQIYLTISTLVEKYKPNMVITDYISDHGKRNVVSDRGYMFPCTRFSGTKPSYEIVNGNLILTKLPKEYDTYQAFKLRVLWRRLLEKKRLSDWDYQDKLTEKLMEATSKITEERRVKLVTINFDTPLTRYQKLSHSDLNVVELDLQKEHGLYLDDGVHPNSNGTTRMVDVFWKQSQKMF